MKKTIFFIDRALPCLFLCKKVTSDLLSSRKINSENVLVVEKNKLLVQNLSLLSLREIKLEWLRRKKSIQFVLVLAFCTLSISAQEKNKVRPMAIGDKVTDFTISKIYNYKVSSTSFSKLKGKAMILDFWATFCSACIKEFPKMQSMQKQYDKNLQIVLVNTYSKDTENVLRDFLAEQKSQIPDFSLPIVQSDSTLRGMFPVKSMPHYLWIGADGRIKAITRADQITTSNIERLIAGLTLNLKPKKD